MELIQRLIIVCVSLFVATHNVYATPKITEIRLIANKGYRMPVDINEYVFRSNGDFYWLHGKSDNPISDKYRIHQGNFVRLANSFENHKFFDFDRKYEGRIISRKGNVVHMVITTHAPSVTLEVIRDGQKYSVQNFNNNGPHGLWELEMLVRGLASQHIPA